MTWESAKHEVATKRGYISWTEVTYNEIDKLYKEAAELYAKAKWEEACEEQQEIIMDELLISLNVSKPEFKP